MSATKRPLASRAALVQAVLLVAGGCGGRQVGAQREAVPDSAPPPVVEGGATADAAPEPSDAAVEEADTPPPCSTDSIFLAVYEAANWQALGSLEVLHPATGELTNLGVFDCNPMPGAIVPPNGLAVDRSGGLFASNLNGIFRVQATDAGFTCQPRNLVNLPFAQPLSIAFVAEAGAGERLLGSFFIVGPGIPRSTPIAIVDLDAGPASVVGDGASPGFGSLTGTGDGRLFISQGATVLQLDLKSGSPLQTLTLPASFFFLNASPIAFWAGEFYVFGLGPFDASSDPREEILRFRPSDGTAVSLGRIDGGRVVGAAVSTCAPLR